MDKPQWAFSLIAEAIVKHLSDRFSFEILARDNLPVIDESKYDIVHVFFESDIYHRPFLHGRAKIIKSVYSHYWEQAGWTPYELYERSLREAHAVTTPSMKLLELLHTLPVPVHLAQEGVDIDVFKPLHTRTGALTVCWAGDPTRPIKRIQWLQEACDGLCELRLAEGKLTKEEMVRFYNDSDVVACSSIAEGCPRPLLEGMACGAFPVSFDVGVAPEVIDHKKNGLLVQDVSVQGLRSALLWCKENLDTVRGAGDLNAERIRGSRSWAAVLQPLAEVYSSVL